MDWGHAATDLRSFDFTPANQPRMAELVRAIYVGGALASHELNHGGRVAAVGIKAAGVKTPILTVGSINTSELAEQILAKSKVDVIVMTRR